MKLVELTLVPGDIEEPTDIDLATTVLGAPGEFGAFGVTLDDIKAKKPKTAKKAQVRQAVLDSYICREWQPGDLINGIDPTSHPNPVIRDEVNRNLAIGGKILLVYEKDDAGIEHLVYFQYHKPEGGPITDINATAAEMVKKQAKHKFLDKLAKETKKAL